MIPTTPVMIGVSAATPSFAYSSQSGSLGIAFPVVGNQSAEKRQL
jgi:hypothetical protein